MNQTTIEQPGDGASSTGSQAGPSAAGPRLAWRSLGWADVVGPVAVSAAFLLAYAPNFASLVATWNREPEYTHGFLVPPIAMLILWLRWPSASEDRPAPWAYGWLLVLASLVARALFHEGGQSWSETATLLPTVAGLALAGGGWRFFRRTWPAFAFLLFMLPLPPALNAILSQPLQAMATRCSCLLLRLSGLWVMPEGNVILVGNEKLEVAEACNGLSMLMSLAATVAATVSLFPMPTWKRATLLAFIIPIALTCNVLRITVTAWCYHMLGAKIGHDYVHDWAGWAMMPLAMCMVYLLYCGMSWLILESVDSRRGGELFAPGQPRQAWNPAGRS